MTNEENRREIDEAIYAGNRALAALNEAQSHLGMARGMGVWDMLGGGLISGVLKHSNMGSAQRSMEKAQMELNAFQRELSDVQMNSYIRIDFDGLSKFVDLVFDNFLVDLLIQSKIKDAQATVENTKRQVEDMIRQLQNARRSLE